MARKILISNNKGGACKSTLSIMLAQELRGYRKKVLTIDLDSQMNTTKFYGSKVEDEYTITDVLYSGVDAVQCIHHEEYGDIIPADPRLARAEAEISADVDRFIVLREGCKSLEDLYDYIVIDTPPSIGVIVRNGFAYADDVIIPITADGWAVGGVMELNKAINLAKKVTNPNLNILGILISNVNPQTKTTRNITNLATELAAAIGTRVFETKIRRSVKIQEALTVHCIPLNIYSPDCTTQMDYESFVEEFLAIEKRIQKEGKN